MNAIVAFALKHRLLMLALFVGVMAGGALAFRQLNIEAYPDPTPPMVDIVTQSPGLSAEEIERYITIPIETQTAAIKNLRVIRTISLYGLSDVKLQFTFDYTYEEALQQVLNRLSSLPALLNNAQPQISPLSPIGEIYRYRLVGPPGYSVLDLKTLQDWVLQRRFRAVPGVIDVTGWGGKTKTYELQVDFNRLIAYGITLPQLLQTHHLHHRGGRPSAGRDVVRHRIAGAKAAGGRGRRRHDARAVRDPDHPAGADLAVLARPTPLRPSRADARAGRLRRPPRGPGRA
jgi:heavy metal efflux system protein